MTEKLLNYFNGDELAASTWLNKYAKRDKHGNIVEQTPADMHKRMAKEFARIEKHYDDNALPFDQEKFSNHYHKREPLTEKRIFELFDKFKYVIPAGSVMAGLGAEKPVSLSNCFVLPSPEDSYSSIMMTRLNQAELMKRRGGVGYDLSKLRPRGAAVNNAAVTSTGAASFMDVCSDVTNEVAQQGRRGALMLSMNVNHPDIEEFIEKKQDLTKVTGANVSVQVTDDFMKAVENDADYLLRWPVDAFNDPCNIMPQDYEEYNKLYSIKTNNHKGYVKKVKAKEIWDKIIHCTWNTAEPGVIFKDRMVNFSPDGCYNKYRGVSTNPCVTGDTKVAVADGRGYVSFEQLVKEGNDVDVYCINDEGNLTISKMINPRISGYNKDIYEVTLENGHKLKCTANHKLLTNDRGYVEVKDLNIGDSLTIMTKSQMNWDERYHKSMGKHQPYNFMFLSGSNKTDTEHRMIYKYNNPDDNIFEVVHHKDFNGLNNSPNNLQGMTAKDHINYHKQKMYGDNNPMVKIKNDPEKLKKYSEKMSKLMTGECNGNCKIILSEYYNEAINFAKSLKRNFYLKEWLQHCKELNWPIIWDNFLQREFGTSKEFIKKIANDANVPYITARGKIMKIYLKALANGYNNVYVNDNETAVMVERTCEWCGNKFVTQWDMREHSYCSRKCANSYMAKYNEKYKLGQIEAGKKKQSIYNERNKKLIEYYLTSNIENFIELKQKFTEDTNIVYDSRAKLAYKNFDEFKMAVSNYNHKIIDIKYLGKDTVYNGTVEKYHNYFTGEFIETNEWGRNKIISVNQKNCGEVFMSGLESCRLIAINMLSFIDKPFTKDANLNVNTVYDVTYDAMRLGDDLVDLENEAVQRILDVVKDDKYAVDVWTGILEKGKNGRRCGLEFTAMSDMCAAMGYKFCTKEANEFIEKVCRLMMSAVLDCQTDMAIERGSFPDYDSNIEGNNEWYKFISEEYPERYHMLNEIGRRNISFTTAGPTGSLSLLAQTSSGIEPVFMPYYVRRRKCVTANDRVDYTDKLGINFTEFVVVHPQLKKWAETNMPELLSKFDALTEKEWEEIYKQSPWYGSCAQDINWQKRVEVQGIVQKYLITHSISSTVNLPNDVTEEEVSNIYMNAWRNELKGITVYRDGSREGIMIKKEQKKEDDKFESYINAPKRPKVLPADFYSTKVKGEVFYVMVGLYKNKPYEIFVYRSENNKIIPQHKGTITKIKKSVYKFDSENIVIENISSKLTTEELATALYSSMLMRTGANLKYIIKTAQKVDDNITSFTAAMVRILRKYEKNEIIEGEKCPECGGKLIRENGCIHCIDCGWSRCE